VLSSFGVLAKWAESVSLSIDIFPEYCHVSVMEPKNPPRQDGELRQEAILAAALDAFQRHGYRRCSMEDIARLAGMSRAALYLYYRNKDDIFVSLVRRAYDDSAAALEAVLREERLPEEALRAGFKAKTAGVVEALAESPHGPELLERGRVIGQAVMEEGEARIVAIFSDWLVREAAAGRITLAPFGGAPEAVAHTILAALNGVKTGHKDLASLRAALDRLAVMVGRALAA